MNRWNHPDPTLVLGCIPESYSLQPCCAGCQCGTRGAGGLAHISDPEPSPPGGIWCSNFSMGCMPSRLAHQNWLWDKNHTSFTLLHHPQLEFGHCDKPPYFEYGLITSIKWGGASFRFKWLGAFSWIWVVLGHSGVTSVGGWHRSRWIVLVLEYTKDSTLDTYQPSWVDDG